VEAAELVIVELIVELGPVGGVLGVIVGFGLLLLEVVGGARLEFGAGTADGLEVDIRVETAALEAILVHDSPTTVLPPPSTLQAARIFQNATAAST
jgi:hypothetical protein